MKYAAYSYQIRVSFSRPVHTHCFLLRCMPPQNAYQKIVTERFHVSPETGSPLNRGTDSFGNIVHSGVISEPHDFFEIESCGEIKLADAYRIRDENPNRLYLYESPFTKKNEYTGALLKSVGGVSEESVSGRVRRLSAAVFEAMEYTQGATSTTTTAGEALAIGKGVCQDFAHILIALCRFSGILARYAAGFLEGEGSTHAWVEYYEDGSWKAVDPTHNCLVETGYIKLSHGRDFGDCSIEKGVFSGSAGQSLSVRLQAAMRDFYA